MAGSQTQLQLDSQVAVPTFNHRHDQGDRHCMSHRPPAPPPSPPHTPIPLPTIDTAAAQSSSAITGHPSLPPRTNRDLKQQYPDLLPTTAASQTVHPRPSKRLSPGLIARLRRLEEQRRSKREAAQRRHSQQQNSIGRIPDSQLADLEQLARQRKLERAEDLTRRGTRIGREKSGTNECHGQWMMPVIGGGVRLSGGPVFTDNEASGSAFEESEFEGYNSCASFAPSSVIDISDALAASDTEDEHLKREAALVDTHKYRLPDCGKTRLDLRTKEPLSPGPISTSARPNEGRRRTASTSAPSTPRTENTPTVAGATNANGLGNGTSPYANGKMENNSQIWHGGNASSEDLSANGGEFRPTLSRANSVYTLGRASFTGQLAQLTSMRLPDADSLAKRISSIPTSTEAAKALTDASEQIRMWIAKANDVLEGLNAEDDVEWAAAGGREGIEDVDKAINRFQRLVEVYILSIERLQTRDDIALLSADEVLQSVKQMEDIVSSWKKIKDTLKGVKDQVEIAMEWQRLWDDVLGEIAQEMEGLHRLVFEMEENRHQGSESVLSSKDSIDISELETIVEEQPGGNKLRQNNRLSMMAFATAPPPTPPAQQDREDASLLALFARMQPLRASLDFLPMRLSTFQTRGNSIFPSACEDLDQRRDQMENQWKRLESDAESLRRELGEDRWITVFRNAGRQALKMCESITRSFQKLKDGVDTNEQSSNVQAMQNKVENYEQKKRHYGPAIERVLAIIDRGVTDRLTVNGEILRLQSDMKRRWTDLQSEMAQMDIALKDIKEELLNAENRDKNLRDSVSTVVSTERSIASSLGVDTPGSSPASSVIGGSHRGSFGSRTPTPLTNIKLRNSSSKANDRSTLTPSSIPRRSLLPKKSISDLQANLRSVSLQTPSKQPMWPHRPEPAPASNKPRFINAMKSDSRDFRPLSAYEPSPYARQPVTPKHNYLRSGLAASTGTPAMPRTIPRIVSAPTPNGPPSSLPRPSTSMATSRKSSLPVANSHLPTPSKPRQGLKSKASAPALRPGSRVASGRRSTMLPAKEKEAKASAEAVTDGNEADNESPAHHHLRRPPSAASGRRSSMLPGSRMGMRSRLGDVEESGGKDGLRPPWRP